MRRKSLPRARRPRTNGRHGQSLLRGRKPVFEFLEERNLLAIITVNSIVDGAPAADGALTLREAMIAANTNAASGDAPAGNVGLDEIRFAIAGAGPHTIAINGATGALPDIVDPLNVDGFTQPGSAPNSASIASSINAVMRIIIDGGGGAFNGFRIVAAGAGTTIRGLVINDFGSDGIEINDSDNNVIIGNFIGTDVTGEIDDGNDGQGVFIDGGANNRVGGTANADRNLISGNGTDGVQIINNGATGNVVLGNFIGTDKDGIQDLGNDSDGVRLTDADMNTIGGTAAGSRNIIAGNGVDGIGLNMEADTNMVLGNFIGLARNGAALGNGDDGIFISGGSSGNTIGGTSTAARNVISSNGDDGIDITGDKTDSNTVLGNFIGLASDGSTDRGNTDNGVEISDQAASNTIGGTTAGARNVISSNLFNGIFISGEDTDGQIIQGNFIGLGSDGKLDRGNKSNGIEIVEGADNNMIGGTAAGAGNRIAFNDVRWRRRRRRQHGQRHPA